MSRQAVTKDLILALAKMLKMPGLARTFEALSREGKESKWTYEEYLHEALKSEHASRMESAIRNRVREARFPEMKTIDKFDFSATDNAIDAAQIANLVRGDWIDRGENVIFAGPIGTGKTHLAIALGIEATRLRKRVLFTRAADLVLKLIEARDKHELTRMQRRLQRSDLVIIDELGFVPFERAGGELLFNVIAERYERRSVIVTTNLQFAEWVGVFGGDEKLTTALLDRLAHHAVVITTKTKSYRMKAKKAS